MQTIKVGVIGVGFMGTNHVKSYDAMPEADLVGVADVDFDRAKSVADQYGTTAYRSVDELLEKSGAEAVSICTSDEQHVEPAIKSLDAGKHVLLEKPLATTLEDADRILKQPRRFLATFWSDIFCVSSIATSRQKKPWRMVESAKL